MTRPPALLVNKKEIQLDPAFQPGARGLRKIVVTELYERTEHGALAVEWKAPAVNEKCPVQVANGSEVSVFNQYAQQDRHFHKSGTELYMVIDGVMTIEVEGEDYLLGSGDMIVVNPGAQHEVKRDESSFLCRVVTLNCGGALDKFPAFAT